MLRLSVLRYFSGLLSLLKLRFLSSIDGMLSIPHSVVSTTCPVVNSCRSCVVFFLQGVLSLVIRFLLQIQDCQLSILDCSLSILYCMFPVGNSVWMLSLLHRLLSMQCALLSILFCLLSILECMLSILDWMWSIALFPVFLFCEFSPLARCGPFWLATVRFRNLSP